MSNTRLGTWRHKHPQERKGLAHQVFQSWIPSQAPEWHAITLWFNFSTYEQMQGSSLQGPKNAITTMASYIFWRKKRENKVLPKDFKEIKNTLMSFSHVRRASTSVAENLCTWAETCQPLHMISVDMAYTLKNTSFGSLIICELWQGLQ